MELSRKRIVGVIKTHTLYGRIGKRRSSRTKLSYELLEPRILLAASISGSRYLDTNGNGQQDLNEAGIAETTIQLFRKDGESFLNI